MSRSRPARDFLHPPPGGRAPYGVVPQREDMVKLVNYCSSQNLPLVIGCDANSHHVCYRTVQRRRACAGCTHAAYVQPAVCIIYALHENGNVLLDSCYSFQLLCFFAQKQGFNHRTVKSEPIWIKFCTHLLFYGIHLRADLDRNRRVHGRLQAKPKRLCFCNTCNAP